MNLNPDQFALDHIDDHPAHVAVMANDLASLRALHAAHGVAALTARLNGTAEFTPLAFAVTLNRRDAIAQLLALGTPVEGTFNVVFVVTRGSPILSHGSTSAMELAAWRGDADMVAQLLAANRRNFLGAMSELSIAYFAAQNAEPGVLKLLVERGFDVRAPNLFGVAPIHAATENANEAVLAVLLQAGCDVAACSADGNSPLHLAARNNPNARVAAALLAAGADVNAANAQDIKPCDFACANPNGDVLAVLVAHGGEFGRLDVALDKAAENPQPFAMQSVLKHPVNLANRNRDGLTPLHVAARHSSGTTVQLLLAAGADIEETSGRLQRSVLQYATMNKDVGALRVLVAAGANVYAADLSSDTVLHTACATDNMAALEVFASVGLDIVEAASVDASLVCSAARAESGTVLRHLIHSGVDFRARNNIGETPCFRASSRGLELLFAAGANLDVAHSIDKASNVNSPLLGYYRLLTLLAAGADIGALPARADNDAIALLAAVGALDQPNVEVSDLRSAAKATDRIAERQWELMRLRGFEIVVGLQPLGQSALVTCEILSFAFAPQVSLIPFHRLWSLATLAKHFH